MHSAQLFEKVLTAFKVHYIACDTPQYELKFLHSDMFYLKHLLFAVASFEAFSAGSLKLLTLEIAVNSGNALNSNGY